MRGVRRRTRRRVAPPGTLFVPRHLLAELREEAAQWAPLETGGMLVGYRADGATGGAEADADAVLLELIAAGPGAIRSRNRFVPDGAWQQHRLEAAYEQSGRVATYLGDWHSHPRGGTHPSKTDRDTYARVAAHADARAPHPIILIISPTRRRGCEAYVMDGSGTREMAIEHM